MGWRQGLRLRVDASPLPPQSGGGDGPTKEDIDKLRRAMFSQQMKELMK
jgi:hypothetical protein